MRKNRTNRIDAQPSPARSKRRGPAADFAAAIARAEFGRFYVDEERLREARQSVADAIARRKPAPKARPASPVAAEESDTSKAPDAETQAAKAVAKRQHMPWKMPSVHERRTEIATGVARLRRDDRSRN